MANKRPLDGISQAIVPSLPARTALFVIAIDLVPYLLGKLEKMRQVDIWADGEDSILGNNLLGEQQMSLLQPITSIDNLYRLLDTTFNGTVYGYTDTDGVIEYTPAIPIVPPPTDSAMLPALAKLRETSTFFVTGSEEYTTPLTSEMTLEARLQVIIDALPEATDNTAIIAELLNIAALLA